MKNILAAALALLALMVPRGAAQSPAAGDLISEVPFKFEKGHVLVQAKVKGDRPVEVALATGAEYSVLNFGLLDKYNLQAYYTGVGVITGSSLDRTVTYAMVSDLQIGDVKASSLNMRLESQAAARVGERVGREIFGILGADFFKGRVVQFDFEKNVVRFLRKAPAAPPSTAGGMPARAVLRMNFKEPVTVPVAENVTFDGKKVKTLFDTGAVAVVALTPSAAKQLGLQPPAEKAGPLAGKVGSVRLGDIEFTDVPVVLHAKGSALDRAADGYGAVAGIALLQNLLVTFDFKERSITLERH